MAYASYWLFIFLFTCWAGFHSENWLKLFFFLITIKIINLCVLFLFEKCCVNLTFEFFDLTDPVGKQWFESLVSIIAARWRGRPLPSFPREWVPIIVVMVNLNSQRIQIRNESTSTVWVEGKWADPRKDWFREPNHAPSASHSWHRFIKIGHQYQLIFNAIPGASLSNCQNDGVDWFVRIESATGRVALLSRCRTRVSCSGGNSLRSAL